MTVHEIIDATTTDVPESVQKIGDQFVSALEQGQKIALDVVETVTGATASLSGPFADATASLSGPFADQFDTSKVPSAAALVAYGYDLAAQVLAAQKEFTLKLIDAYTPAKR